MAVATPLEWSTLVDWFNAREAAGERTPQWRRVVFGYDVLFKNCADPTADVLEFNEEFKALRLICDSAPEFAEHGLGCALKLDPGVHPVIHRDTIIAAANQLAALRKETALLRELLQSFVENDTTPAPNCSCHISPPCGDCVEFAAMRELVAHAKRQLGL